MSSAPESRDSVLFEFNDLDTPPDTTVRPISGGTLRRLLGQQLLDERAMQRHVDDLGRWLALAQQQEEICRRGNDLAGLSHCLANQALIRKAQGALPDALRLHEEAQSVYSQRGDVRGLVHVLFSRAELLAAINDLHEAVGVLERAYDLATRAGQADLIERARPALEAMRQRLNGA